MKYLVLLAAISCFVDFARCGFFDNIGKDLDTFLPSLANTQLDQNGVTKLINQIQTLMKINDPKSLNITYDRWWGDEDNQIVDESIREFQITFSDDMIQDLKNRLQNHRSITKSLKNSVHTYGINTDLLQKIVDYWSNEYDFKAREQNLNRFPHYLTNVQGLDIHYIHIKPETTKPVVPILLIHGSPLTVFEYNHLIDELSVLDKDFALEIVAPDLPGFGYSQGTNEMGLNGYQMAIIFKNLMTRLGHQQFYVHCGDVGTWPGNSLAVLYPDDILGLHTNLAYSLMPKTLIKMGLGAFFPRAVVESQYEDRMYPLATHAKDLIENTGYMHQFGTRPDNVAIGLNESPIALAAWILPLMMLGSEGNALNNRVEDGMLYENYEIDDLIDSLTIYWDSQCIGTSARLHAEEFGMIQDPNTLTIYMSPVEVPLAVVKFKDEIIYMPDSFLGDKYKNIVQSKSFDYGGHFAALGNSVKDLAASIWTAIPTMEEFNAKKGEDKGLLARLFG